MSSLSTCNLCPRSCGVDRTARQPGVCQAGAKAEIYRYAPHHGEEPPISGSKGSGTIFFSHCTLSCVYCQNHQFSQQGAGDVYTVEDLAGVFRELKECHNWNLVSPTPYLPMIKDALEIVKDDGISIPVVYNTSGFERVDILKEYEGMIDIFLSDLRYSNEETGKEGSGVSHYVEASRKALLEMWRQVGALKVDGDGFAESGVICRMLILPGRAQEVVDNLEWLAQEVGTEISLSVMAQYLPAYKAGDIENWDREISKEEYDLVSSAVENMGFTEGWVQEYGGSAAKDLLGFNMTKKEKQIL